MKNNFLISIIIFIILFIASSCLTKDKCVNNYNFEFPIEIAPSAEIYNIGDTIWVDLTYDSSKIFDLSSSSTLDIGSLNLDLSFGMTRFDDTIDVYGIDYFDTVIENGDLQRNDLVGVSVYKISFTPTEQTYQLKFGIIPNTKGSFAIGFTSKLPFDKDELELTDTDCKEYVQDLTFEINNGANNGYDFYISNIGSPYSDVSFQEYTFEGVYSFEVIE